MGLPEEIEDAFGEAVAQGGVRLLATDRDDVVWVAGLAATDGTLSTRSASARAIPLFIHLGD